MLDVAGGRGDMSFELNVLRKVKCMTIDPRPPKLSKRQRKWMKKNQKKKRRKMEAAALAGGEQEGEQEGE